MNIKIFQDICENIRPKYNSSLFRSLSTIQKMGHFSIDKCILMRENYAVLIKIGNKYIT